MNVCTARYPILGTISRGLALEIIKSDYEHSQKSSTALCFLQVLAFFKLSSKLYA